MRIAWFGLVAPALVLNYFGQGALLIADPEAVENPFYLLLPGWALYPMVVLATAATVIASQAVISGAYSITKQAVQLGFLPRMNIVQTSAREIGQIYIPSVNWLLCAAVIAAVVGFGSSSRLAGAYGVAVTGTMLVDTLLTFFVIRYGWRYPLWLCLVRHRLLPRHRRRLLLARRCSRSPTAAGSRSPSAPAVFIVMTTWRRGREIMFAAPERLLGAARAVPQVACSRDPPQRVPGTAIFLTATPDATPHALLHNLNHNKVLHERVVFLTVEIARRALGAVRGARRVRAPRPRLLARARALRLHEPARRDARARAVRRRSAWSST